MENQEKKVKLFREKSLEAIESPESLNDYLRVTSPGVWLVMAAVIAVLLGMIIWSIFGRIDTKVNLAVSTSGGQSVCYVPYKELQNVMKAGKVTVDGKEYPLTQQSDAQVLIVSEETNPFVRVAGNLKAGDMAVEVPLDAQLEDGVVTGVAVTESLQPLALLIQ